MKRALILTVLLSGCSTMATSQDYKSNGEEVFDVIFKSINLPLKDEPLCNVISTTRKSESLSLGQHLATNLSVSYESKNTVEIKSACAPSKFETKSKEILDVLDCKIEILEKSKKGEFISSSMIAFSTDLNKTRVLPGSVRCF
jgi:PBP1b-binding outer membrane lipoprotein LpoB